MISPCVNICKYDPHTQICSGCARTLDEITNWSSYTDAERDEIMNRVFVKPVNNIDAEIK